MNITVVGTGYVGLVTGTGFAEVGNHVICVDADADKIKSLKKGIVPIYEPGLNSLVADNMEAERLRFTTSIEEGVAHAEIIFIAVGTPPEQDGSADIENVKKVAQSIGELMTDYKVVVTKSTVPVGTAQLVTDCIQNALQHRKEKPEEKPKEKIEFAVVSNPEFLKEGAAVEDFMKPDRIVVGVDDDRAQDLLRNLYAPFNRNHDRLIVMDIASAEMTKYAANAMLATKISFINEMSNLAELLGADIESVRVGIGADPRIGYSYIYPGCGYGGSCFPKDVRALHRTAKSVDYDSRILHAVEAVNNDQKQLPVKKLFNHFGNDLNGKVIALWGLAFKPDTDDMRDAPSKIVMEAVWKAGGVIQAFDPVAIEEAGRIYGRRKDLRLHHESPYEAVEGADCLIVVTEWRVFRGSNLDRVADLMRGNVVIDGRNIFSPEDAREAGLEYYGIGRK